MILGGLAGLRGGIILVAVSVMVKFITLPLFGVLGIIRIIRENRLRLNLLPLIEAAGGGEAAYGAIIMPMSLALVERCDGCLRIGGESKGADAEVARFRAAGKPVWFAVDQLPAAGGD